METINEITNDLGKGLLDMENVLPMKQALDSDGKLLYTYYTNDDVWINREIRLRNRIRREIKDHLEANNRLLEAEYDLILHKESKLSARCRKFIIDHYNQ